MGEHRSPHRSPSLPHGLQEGRDFYILSCSLCFLFTFPSLPKPPWLALTALLFPAFRMAFTSWKGDEFSQCCISVVTVQRPQETGTERLTCTPRLAWALAANTRQMLYLIPFKVLLHEWDAWLDQTLWHEENFPARNMLSSGGCFFRNLHPIFKAKGFAALTF